MAKQTTFTDTAAAVRLSCTFQPDFETILFLRHDFFFLLSFYWLIHLYSLKVLLHNLWALLYKWTWIRSVPLPFFTSRVVWVNNCEFKSVNDGTWNILLADIVFFIIVKIWFLSPKINFHMSLWKRPSFGNIIWSGSRQKWMLLSFCNIIHSKHIEDYDTQKRGLSTSPSHSEPPLVFLILICLMLHLTHLQKKTLKSLSLG